MNGPKRLGRIVKLDNGYLIGTGASDAVFKYVASLDEAVNTILMSDPEAKGPDWVQTCFIDELDGGFIIGERVQNVGILPSVIVPNSDMAPATIKARIRQIFNPPAQPVVVPGPSTGVN